MAENKICEFELLSREFSIPVATVKSIVRLLDEGNTPAFITRFRKEESHGVNESKILELKRRIAVQRALAERKGIILKSIESQGALTDSLAQAIQESQTAKQLEDLYLPYKPKKQSLGQMARQRGLEPLADDIFKGSAPDVELAAQATHYVRVDKGLTSVDDVFKGVGHIIAERLANNVEIREKSRELYWSTGEIVTRGLEPGSNNDSETTVGDPAAPEGTLESEPADTDRPAKTAELKVGNPQSPGDSGQTEGEIASGNTPPPSGTVSTEADVTQAAPPGPSADSAASPDADSKDSSPSPSESPTTSESRPTPEVDKTADPPTASESNQAAATSSDLPDVKPKKRKKKKTAKHLRPFKEYENFSERVKKLPSHRILAINRAERSKNIRVRIKIDDDKIRELIQSTITPDHPFASFLEKCAQDAMQRLVLPSIEREVRREITETAERHALRVFGRNLRHLLLKPPVRGRRVIAVDPGFRYGCHAAALDEFGNYLAHVVFHVVGNEKRRAEGKSKLCDLIQQHQGKMIAIGNGSACREAEQTVSDLINSELSEHDLQYVIVNEAGTNAYATGEVGREELPHLEPAVRSAVSIGRRLFDPLSELVKVDPAHLGIGLYQHDIRAKHLANELDDVVASCVNYVGVDVNQASPALLSYVSGLGKLTARRLYEYRRQNGPFKNRQQFREIAGFGEQTFTQAAGFLRIFDGDEPLDSTSIHPESYELARTLLAKAGFQAQDLMPPKLEVAPQPTADSSSADPSAAAGLEPPPAANSEDLNNAAESAGATAAASEVAEPQKANEATPVSPAERPPTQGPGAAIDMNQWHQRRQQIRNALRELDLAKLAKEIGASEMLLKDLSQALSQFGVDPRDRLPSVVFRRGILKFENIKPEMQLKGQVVNVVDFGVFVDIGLGDSSLIHISRLSESYVSDPHLMFAVGDAIDVWVTQVDSQRRRVTLTAVPPAHRPAGGGRSSEGRPSRPPRRSQRGTARASSGATAGDRGKSRADGRGRAYQKRIHKPARPVKPITKDMIEGTAPMRSFSDLAQFFQQKTSEKRAKE